MSSFPRRPARRADLQEVAELVATLDLELEGRSDYTVADLEDEWRDIDPERDAWVWEDGAGIAAYGTVELRGDVGRSDGYVHPRAWGRGLGAALVAELEEELRRRGAARVHNATLFTDPRAQELLRNAGYGEVRRFWQMRIELAAPPAPPRWPEGVTTERLDLADLAEFHEAFEDAFADHWTHERSSLERFRHRHVEAEGFDPMLWRVVRGEGGEIVAGTVCHPERMGAAWISGLFTRRACRGRGLGSALLADAFGTFWERGLRTIGLGVDAQSDTGAQRLYERAGMHVHLGAIVFEKTL